MPLIKPVSDLRNYPDVLKDVKSGSPVYLTKNGTGRYVLIDIADYNSVESAMKLNMELMRGRISGERDGWINKSEMRAHFMEKANA
jgi:prevent-host-death family protein